MATTEYKEAVAVDVYNAFGDRVGVVEIDPADFGGKINQQLLHDAVLMYEANRRRGTHCTKRRSEVAGSTRKLFRQKGTGHARVGNRRTNKRRGGGTAKGPKPRDYVYHMPKKAVRAATRMAILSKFVDNQAKVVEKLELPEIKTRHVADILENLEIDGLSCLIGLGEKDIDDRKTVYMSARNIPMVEVSPASQLNTYSVLRPECLLLTREALEELCDKLTWKEAEDLPVEDQENDDEADEEAEDAEED